MSFNSTGGLQKIDEYSTFKKKAALKKGNTNIVVFKIYTKACKHGRGIQSAQSIKVTNTVKKR
eukprot:UN10958